MRRLALLAACAVAFAACSQPAPAPQAADAAANYFDNTGRDDVLSGGVKMIPITTPKGTFRVWTKRVGNNPTTKVLLLHGGPGATHEYFECCDSFLPGAGVEYYYYDQLARAVGAGAVHLGRARRAERALVAADPRRVTRPQRRLAPLTRLPHLQHLATLR